MAETRARWRRESIDDHLTTARARFPELQPPGAGGSRPFVRDLVRRGFINGPHQRPKASSPGQAERFAPADYRALIEILRLRAQGHIHRSRWLVWLWLRGRDYPIDRVREALEREVEITFENIRAQLNPSGRATQPFHASYERNVAPRRGDSPFPDFGGMEEVVAALMFRPHEVGSIPVDIGDIAAFAAETLGGDPAGFEALFQGFSTNPPADFREAANRVGALLPAGPMPNMLHAIVESGLSFEPLAHLPGMLGDGAGGSTLQTALREASDEELLNARAGIRLLRTGRLERQIAQIPLFYPSAEPGTIEFALEYARVQRAIHRGNPAMAGYLTGIYVLCAGDPIPLPTPPTTTANQLLKYLREKYQD